MFPSLFTLFFLVLAVSLGFAGRLPIAILVCYAAASIVAFMMYALDKSAAIKHHWRTRESTLHMIALFGGWPGALVAQRLLRHKSAKTSFQVIFWITVVLNCGALVWIFLFFDGQGTHG